MYDAVLVVGLGLVPTFKVTELNCIEAILALTITLPVGPLTVMPAPCERLTDNTAAFAVESYISSKFC